MSTSTPTRPTSRSKKIWTIVGVGALAAAVAGGGALSTLVTSIDGNRFTAPVPGSTTQPGGALLTIDGTPINHPFETGAYNQLVQASWELENHGPDTATFDASFRTLADIDPALADALTVSYGLHDADGTLVGWADGGTVARPTPFATATGIDSIAGHTTIPVLVEVKLEDPSVLADDSAVGGTLTVVADFVVSYLDPTLP